MCSGRLVISIAGNMSEAQAIEVAEKAVSALALKPVAVNELPVDQTTRLKEGKTITFEEPVRDEKNENSCALVLYQDDYADSKTTTKQYLLVDVVAKFLEQAFFDDLRTKQQLGYSVHAGCAGTAYIPEVYFKVQSPTKSAAYIIGAINKFLLEKREEAKTLSEETFNEFRGAVRTQYAIRDTSMYKETDRANSEIFSHSLLFDRYTRDLEVIDSLTLDEFRAFFEHMFFSDKSKRLDIQLVSAKSKAEQVEHSAKIDAEDEIFTKYLPREKHTSVDEAKQSMTDRHANWFMKWYGEFLAQGDSKM